MVLCRSQFYWLPVVLSGYHVVVHIGSQWLLVVLNVSQWLSVLLNGSK